MESMRAEAISSFNKYVDTLLDDKDSTYTMSLLQFDSMKMNRVFDMLELKHVPRLTTETYKPGASTPLYDAIGESIKHTEGKIAKGQKVVTVVLTDGQENASKEWTKEKLLERIKECEKNQWAFTYLAVAVEAWKGAEAFCGTSLHANEIKTSGGIQLNAAVDLCATGTKRYSSGIRGMCNFYDDSETDAVSNT